MLASILPAIYGDRRYRLEQGLGQSETREGFFRSMMFAVEADTMSLIKMYVIPDSGGTVPSIIVRNDGVEVLEMRSNETQVHLIAAGRHSTGECGFVIDTGLLPDLATYTKLEILERDSGLMLYRRPRADFVKMKIFRLETHLLPLWRIDDALKDSFQYWFKGVDRLGRETAQQTFNLPNNNSMYTSGRLFMRNVERFISQGLKAVAMIRDPYEELAERLIILKNVGEQKVDLLGPRDALIFEGLIAELAVMESLDAGACKRFFKTVPTDTISTLSNPLTRQLTVTNPTDMPPQSCIGMALQILAQFTVIGLRSDAQEFSSALSELFDMAPGRIPVMKEFTKVKELGNILREIGDVEHILEKDLELFHHMREIFSSLPSG